MFKTVLKLIQGNSSNEAGLRKHLGNVHNMKHLFFKSQTGLSSTKFEINPQETKKFHEAAINAIIQDGLPFGIFRKPGVANFLNTLKPGYKAPHRKTARRLIGGKYKNYKKVLQEKLKKVTKIALTTDLWKSNSSFDHLTVTGHFFNKKFEYHSTILGFERLKGQHSSINLNSAIKRSLNSLNFDFTKISSITSDNSNDIKNATSKDFGLRNGCLCHILNLVVQNGLKLWTDNK